MFAQYTEFGAYGSVLRSKDACGGDLFRNEEHVGWKGGELLVMDRTLGAFSLHDNTSEAFIPLEGTAVLVVARKDDLSDQKSFLLDRPVIIEPSVWHGLYAPCGEVRMLILENSIVNMKKKTCMEGECHDQS